MDTRSGKPIALILHRGEKLGDAVLRIPVYRALRMALPEHSIVSASVEPTVWSTTLSAVRHEFIDKILVDQPLDNGAGQIRTLIRSLGKVEFVFDLRSNKRVLWSYIATAGMPVRYLGNAAGYILRRRVRGFWEGRPASNAQRWHRMVELAVGRLLPFDSQLAVQPAARDESLRLLPEGRRFIGLSPGPDTNKFWDRERWTALARHIADRNIEPVFLLGPQESDQRAWIERDGKSTIIDAGSVPDPALLPWVFHALADRAVGIVAAESGLGHLAATRGRAVLTIAGPTDARQWRPVTPYHWVVQSTEFGSRATNDIPLAVVDACVDEMVRWSLESGTSRMGGSPF